MTTIYERHAVCSDVTWAALSTEDQATYDAHYSSWTLWLAATKSDLITIASGCREVIIWDEFGELPRINPNVAQIGTNDATNYTIFRSHSSARPDWANGTGLAMAGATDNYQMKFVIFDGFIFDERTDGTSGSNFYLDFAHNWVSFENCIFANIYYALYNVLTTGYFKNCLFYNWNTYFREGSTGTAFYNCGFYNTFNHQYTFGFKTGEFYNCWAYDTDVLTDGIFAAACTGDNNYASDGSGPIAERTLATFGFTNGAGKDFTLLSTSPLFDAGVTQGEELSVDMLGNPRSAGAEVDIGPFEKAVGTTLTFSGVVIGSAISVVDLDNGGFIVEPFVASTARGSQARIWPR